MKKVYLVFSNNYNGWSCEVDGKAETDYDFSDSLCDVTVDHTDEDGDYFYSQSLIPEDEIQVRKLVKQQFGDVELTIEIDQLST